MDAGISFFYSCSKDTILKKIMYWLGFSYYKKVIIYIIDIRGGHSGWKYVIALQKYIPAIIALKS